MKFHSISRLKILPIAFTKRHCIRGNEQIIMIKIIALDLIKYSYYDNFKHSLAVSTPFSFQTSKNR